MTQNFNNRTLAASQKVYGWLLSAYPLAHRMEYGPAMAQLFRDQGRDAWNESQGWGMAKLWLRVLPDLVNTSITERLAAFNPRKSMSDKMTALFRPLTSPLTGFFTVFTAVFLVVLLVSVTITFLLPESYASTARIKVESDAPPPYFIQTEFEILQSRIVLEPVIAKLNLNVEWGKKYFAGQTLKTSETMEYVKRRLTLAPVRGTKLIAITVYSDDRNEAARIANAIAESYRDYRMAAAGDSVSPSQKASMVQIVDRAEPGRAPVKPNKPLNIILGAVAGVVLGSVAGAAAAFVSSKFGNRGRKNVAAV